MTLKVSKMARGLRPGDHYLRLSLLIVGGGMAAFALWAGEGWLMLPGGIMLGYAFRPDAERYYMEGFGDGVDAGAALERDAARMDSRGEGLRTDEPRGAVRGTDPHQLAAGAPDPVGRFSEPVPVPAERPRPARPAVTEDGRPIPATGPRAPAFPEVVAGGTRLAHYGEADRPETGSETGTGISTEG